MPVRVYIEDTDAGGVVYYANYLKFMERARTEALRSCGVDLGEWQHQHRRLFVVRSVSVSYRKPARYSDLLTVCANMMTIKAASLLIEQPILRDNVVLVESTVRLACIDTDTLGPVPIPDQIRAALQHAPNETLRGDDS